MKRLILITYGGCFYRGHAYFLQPEYLSCIFIERRHRTDRKERLTLVICLGFFDNFNRLIMG